MKLPEQSLPSGVIDQVLGWNRVYTDSFGDYYKLFDQPEDKFRLAVGLIRDGRYPDPVFLAKNFIVEDQVVTLELEAMRDQIWALLEERQRIPVGSVNEPQAQEAILRQIGQDEVLSSLNGVVPIHIMGAIAASRLFSQADPEVQEHLRSVTTRSLLRPHLGPVTYPVGGGGSAADINRVIEAVPEKVFSDTDSITFNLIRHYITVSALDFFSQIDESEGFHRLQNAINQETNGTKRDFLTKIADGLRKRFDETRPPERFKEKIIDAALGESPFPHPIQKYYLGEALAAGKALIRGGTGGGKTGFSLAFMEMTGSKKPLIIGPARARETWPAMARKHVKDERKLSVFPVYGMDGVSNPRFEEDEGVFVSSDLLADLARRPKEYAEFCQHLKNRGTDGLIIDEAHIFRNLGAASSQILADIAGRLRNDYCPLHPEKKDLPILALTATPIKSSLSDLDVPMAILYPEKYVLPGVADDHKLTFSGQVVNNPHLAFSSLIGEGRMLQWSAKDMFGEKVPEVAFDKVERISVEMTPYQKVIYDYVVELKTDALNKTYLLRSVLLNPQLVRDACLNNEWGHGTKAEKAELETQLRSFFVLWEKWRENRETAIADEPFSADWLAKMGQTSFLLGCFLSKDLTFGVDSLAAQDPQIREYWKNQDVPSSKFAWCRKFLEGQLVSLDGKVTTNDKVVFISPLHKRGVTRDMAEKMTPVEARENYISLYEYFKDWFRELPSETFFAIDGRMSFKRRLDKARLWQESGNMCNVGVATLGSIEESIDLAVRETKHNKNIGEVAVVLMGWPWDAAQLAQVTGRFVRPGIAKKVQFVMLENEGTIDQGFYELVRAKYLLMEMALHGIELSENEKKLFDHKEEANFLVSRPVRSRDFFVSDLLRRQRAHGEESLLASLAEAGDGGVTSGELWAKLYLDGGADEHRTVGDNAELVRTVLSRYSPQRVLSIGSGTSLLNRKIIQAGQSISVDNLDINLAVLEASKSEFRGVPGRWVQAKASTVGNLFANGVYDAVDCSYMLDLTAPGEERIRVLTGINEVLRDGGAAVISLPNASLDNMAFTEFCLTLEKYFGFEVVMKASGASFGMMGDPTLDPSVPRKHLGWIITLKKKGDPTLADLPPESMALLTDTKIRVSLTGGSNGGKELPTRMEYPIFLATDFEVRNPRSNEVILHTKAHIKRGANVPGYQTVEDFRRSLALGQYEMWKRLQRIFEKERNLEYDQAMVELYEWLTVHNQLTPKTWSVEWLNKTKQAIERSLHISDRIKLGGENG